MLRSMPRSLVLLLLWLVSAAAGAEVNTDYGGHTKLRLVGQSFPENSVFRSLAGPNALDVTADLRVRDRIGHIDACRIGQHRGIDFIFGSDDDAG